MILTIDPNFPTKTSKSSGNSANYVALFLGWWVDVRDPNSKVGQVTVQLVIKRNNELNHLEEKNTHPIKCITCLLYWVVLEDEVLQSLSLFPTNFTWMHQVTKVTTTWLNVMKPVKIDHEIGKKRTVLGIHMFVCQRVHTGFYEKPYVSWTGIRYYPLEPYGICFRSIR